MFNATDDDDFCTSAASASNLANLFSGPPHMDSAASLIYTAPKQPPRVDAVDGKTKPKPQVKTICVKTVHLYKLVDASYASQGKHGLAIIGDPELNTYDLLLYKTRTNITSSIKINSSFLYAHSKDHCSFKDQQLNFWRVHFENAKDDAEFLSMMQSKGATVVRQQDGTEVEEEVKAVEQEDALSDGSQARANILVRISKVGQSMLPAGKNPDLSESEPDEIVKTKKVVRKPKRHSTSDKDNFHTSDIPEQNAPQYMVPMQTTSMQPQYMLGGQYLPPNQMVPCQMMAINDPLAVHFSENRTHNSEVRMNLSQLSNKLDSVLNELNYLRVTVPPVPPAQSETAILHGKIEDLERKLLGLTSTGDSSEMVGKLQGEVDRLNEELQRCKDEETILKHRITELNDEVERRIKSEDEKDAVISEQNISIKHFEAVETKLDDSRETINNLQENVTNLKRTIELQAVELEEKRKLESTVLALKSAAEKQELEIKEQHNKLKELEESKEDNVKVFAEVIKQTMNTMYQNILEKCGDDSEFRKVLSQNMKSTTFQIIQDYKKNVMERWVKHEDEINPPPVPEFEVTV